MNRQSTSSTLNKLMLNGDSSSRHGDLFNEHTASDPEFYSNGNHFEEDLYDFNTINQANLQQRAPNSSDEEEDDINFDYEYGFDYDKMIKERLKEANKAFEDEKNDPPKRKSVLVSFDNAVTAIELAGAETELDDSIPSTPTVSSKNSATKKTVLVAPPSDSISKLPLNDTVQKEDPDRFANKIKEAIQRYDAEMSEMQASHNMNEVAGKSDNTPVVTNQQVSQRKPSFEDEKTKKTPSPSSSPTNKSYNLNGNNNNNNRSTPPRSPDQQPPPPQKYNSKVINIVSHEDDSSISDLANDDDGHVHKKTDSALGKNDDKSFSFKPFASSPSVSPILAPKTASSPDQSNPKNNSNFNFSSSSKSKQGSQSISPTNRTNNMGGGGGGSPASSIADEDGTVDKKKTQFKNTSPTSSSSLGQSDRKSSSDKMLIEKDGDFLLLSQEEYLAMKEAEKIEAKSENKNKSSPTKNVIPHPPQRPKTTQDRGSNRFRTQNNDTSNQNANNSRPTKPLTRPSHSADVNSRNRARDSSKSFSPIRQHRTPEYAQNYRSPYHMEVKVYKPVETAEEKKKKEQEKEERRRMNQEAYELWCKKEKERRRKREEEEKLKQSNKLTSNETSSTSNENRKMLSYEEWLEHKTKQDQRKHEFERKLEILNETEKVKISPEERAKAFKDWLNRKIREKNEQLRLEKLENKKWVARRRRSRKHQRLFQAIEMAQAFGYTNTQNMTGPYN